MTSVYFFVSVHVKSVIAQHKVKTKLFINRFSIIGKKRGNAERLPA
jgi:hypothetical protein